MSGSRAGPTGPSRVRVPLSLRPSSPAGGVGARIDKLPGVRARPAAGRGAAIARGCYPPAAIAEAVPAVPSTEGGGVACPSRFQPQQTTAPLPAWIAQLCRPPAAIVKAVPAVPSTEGGGVACPKQSPPQQPNTSLPAWIAHL